MGNHYLIPESSCEEQWLVWQFIWYNKLLLNSIIPIIAQMAETALFT